MFKGLTDRAQRVLTVLAEEVAKRSRSDQVLPEHILIAIIDEGEGIGFRPPQPQDRHPRAARRARAFDRQAPLGRHRRRPAPRSALPVLAGGGGRGGDMSGSDYIGTEHFVVAAAREQGSTLEAHLARIGVYYEQLRAAVRLLREPQAEDRKERRSMRSEGRPEGRGEGKAAGGRTPLLDEFARDLTALARKGKLDPVVGREREIGRVIRILSRRTKNNPSSSGSPGSARRRWWRPLPSVSRVETRRTRSCASAFSRSISPPSSPARNTGANSKSG